MVLGINGAATLHGYVLQQLKLSGPSTLLDPWSGDKPGGEVLKPVEWSQTPTVASVPLTEGLNRKIRSQSLGIIVSPGQRCCGGFDICVRGYFYFPNCALISSAPILDSNSEPPVTATLSQLFPKILRTTFVLSLTP